MHRHLLSALGLTGVLTMVGAVCPPAMAGQQTAGQALASGSVVADAGQSSRSPRTAVLRWSEAAGRAAVAACIAPVDNPLTESRMYAMTSIAVHDALNAIDRRYRPYAADFRAPRGASVEAAVATAAHDVLASVFAHFPEPFGQACGDKGLASVEADYAAAMAAIPASPVKTAGVATGRRAAQAIIARRSGDGSQTPLVVADYPQGTQPGVWRFTADRPFAFAPGWGSVQPFALASADQFRSAPPHALESDAYAEDVNEVKRLGSDGISSPTARTAAQTETALFWLESSPLAWNRMARTVARQAHLDPWDQARMLALLGIAMADGYIGSFAQKYDDRFWRPETAIQLADTDGNPATTADPAWRPLVTTPPIPDHDSAHAVEGGAAATVMRQVLGRDTFRFAVCSNTLPSNTCADASPTTHSFGRFSDAARENSVSRIYIGFHFRWAVVQGQEHGERIGEYVVDHLLRPAS